MANFIAIISPDKNDVVIDMAKMTGATSPVTLNFDASDLDDEGIDWVERNIYVNSVPLGMLKSDGYYSMTNICHPYIFVIHVYPDETGYIDREIQITSGSANITLVIDASSSRTLEYYENQASQINGKLESFMLLRTNPKLTGNVKLVVDSQYHLYLDTFSATSVLNSRQFKKFPISSDGNYPHDVMTVFGSLPKGELFALPGDALNPHKIYNDYENQYVTDYEYGAQTNDDNLYPENMKILAPLHLGKTVPDFFCIFRYDGTFNKESYSQSDINDLNKMNSLIRNSVVVRIFDLRRYTSIGNYLNAYKESLYDFLYGSCYMQFIEQDNEIGSINYRQGNNSWKGVDVERGIITNKIESSYFANNVINKETGAQEAYDDYIINGYERNNVLYPYILNLEFMFDDPDTEEYSMHRYFGLYLKQNDFFKYQCMVTDNSVADSVVYKYDAEDNIIDDYNVLSLVTSEEYDDKIFFMTTNNDAVRIQSTDDAQKFLDNYVLDNPDANICNIKADYIERNSQPQSTGDMAEVSHLWDTNADRLSWSYDDESFITLTFKDPVMYGEHFRIIMLGVYNEDTEQNENMCFEVIASNDSRLLSADYMINPYVSTNKIENSLSSSDVVNNMFRISFYTQSTTDENEQASLAEQLERMEHAFEKMQCLFYVSSRNGDTICFVSKHPDTYFQHIYATNKIDEPRLDGMIKKGNTVVYSTQFDVLTTPDDSMYMKRMLKKYGVSGSVSDGYYDGGDESIFWENNSDVGKAVQYAEFELEGNRQEDSVMYFSRNNTGYMVPLSPDTVHYADRYALFSLSGYESLGWRWNSVSKFKVISSMKYAFACWGSLDEILKKTKHPLVKSRMGTYEQMRKIHVSQGYVTDNVLRVLGFGKDNQECVQEERILDYIVCPTDANASLLSFDIYPDEHNFQISVFSPESATISIMGILCLKDMELGIDLQKNVAYPSKRGQLIKSGTQVSVYGHYQSYILPGTFYEVVSGSFQEYAMNRFAVCAKKIYYTTSDDNSVHSADFEGGTLTAATDVYIRALEDSYMSEDDTDTTIIPVHKSDNFYKDSENLRTSSLDYPVVPQTNCVWKSNGLYLDGNNTLDVENMRNGDYCFRGRFTEHFGSPLVESVPQRVVSDLPETYGRFLTYAGEITKSFRTLINEGELKSPLRKMLMGATHIDCATGQYNPYVQSLEFVSCGMKFTITFTNEYYNRSIRLDEYNNFDTYVVTDYNPDMKNEIIISVDEEIILVINRNYEIYRGNLLQSNFYGENQGMISSGHCGVSRAPFSVYSTSITGYVSDDGFCASYKKNTDAEITFDKDKEDVYFVQNDWPSSGYYPSEKIWPSFYGVKMTAVDDEGNLKTDDYDGVIKSPATETFVLKRSSGDSFSTIHFAYSAGINDKYTGNNTKNSSASYVVREFKEGQPERTTSIDMDEFIKSMDREFLCTIIKGGHTEEALINDKYKPIVLSISKPKKIKYNFGYFAPKTYDLLNFETNDFELSKVIDMDLMLANTKIKSIGRIDCYSGNKVFNENGSVVRNFFTINGRSIFTSNWDYGYYRAYDISSEERFRYISGYKPGIEDKSFFGSRCFTLKSPVLVLDEFSTMNSDSKTKIVDSAYNTYDQNQSMMKITINITQSMYRYFEANQVFCDNWNGLIDDIETSKKNYIKYSISKIFNPQRATDVVIWVKGHSGHMSVDFSSIPEPEQNGWAVMEDFKTEFSVVNDDTILDIYIQEKKDIIVHPVVKIYRYSDKKNVIN